MFEVPTTPAVVVTVTEAEVWPAGIVRVAGTPAMDGLWLLSVTTMSEAAVAFTLTVNVVVFPLVTVVLPRATAVMCRCTTSMVAALVTVPRVARIKPAETGRAPPAMVNCAEVAPSGIVTVDGRVSRLVLELRVMTEPPAGAGLETVTVPTVEVEARMVVFWMVKLAR